MLSNIARLSNAAGIMGSLYVGRDPASVAICILPKGSSQKEIVASLSEQIDTHYGSSLNGSCM